MSATISQDFGSSVIETFQRVRDSVLGYVKAHPIKTVAVSALAVSAYLTPVGAGLLAVSASFKLFDLTEWGSDNFFPFVAKSTPSVLVGAIGGILVLGTASGTADRRMSGLDAAHKTILTQIIESNDLTVGKTLHAEGLCYGLNAFSWKRMAVTLDANVADYKGAAGADRFLTLQLRDDQGRTSTEKFHIPPPLRTVTWPTGYNQINTKEFPSPKTGPGN